MRHRSARRASWEPWHAASRAAVMLRARGQCEGCQRTDRPLSWCHLFGRRNIIGEPLCSDPAFTEALCEPCHTDIDQARNPALLAVLRRLAVNRYAREHALELPLPGSDPLGVVRQWERDRVQANWET